MSDWDRNRQGGQRGDQGAGESAEQEHPDHPLRMFHENPVKARALYKRYVQRKAARKEATKSAQIPEGGGAPLASDVRERMEGQLGADLSGVKVHAGGESAQAADQLGARAFTAGNDVHFGSGEYSPGTKEGDKLLAHELTHVVQGQRSGVQRKAGSAGRIEMIHDAPAPDPYVVPINSDEDRIQRKAEGGIESEHDDGSDAAHEVSHPGDPAEEEADAVADQVGERLHGDGEGEATAKEHGPEAKEQAPSIGAKLRTDGRPGLFLKEKDKKNSARPGKPPGEKGEHASAGKRDIDRRPDAGASDAGWVHYLSDLQRFLRDQTGAEKQMLLDLREQREAHPVVGTVAESAASVKAGFHDVKVPDEGIWDQVFAQLNKAHALAAGDKPDIEGAKREMATAVRLFQEAHRKTYEYKSRTEGGAETAANVLRGVEVGCDITLTILSAGAGAGSANVLKLGARGVFKLAAEQTVKSGLVKTAVKAGITGGVNELAQGAAGKGTAKAIGADGDFDVGALLEDAGESAVTNFLGVLVGGALSKVFMRKLGEILGSRLAPEALLALAEKYGVQGVIPAELFVSKGWRFLVGVAGDACTTTLLTALSAAVELARKGGKPPTAEHFVSMVVEQLIRNGLLQVVLSAVTHERAASAGSKVPRAGDASTTGGPQSKEPPSAAGSTSTAAVEHTAPGPQGGPKQHTPENAAAEKASSASPHADAAKPDAAKRIAELRGQVSTEAQAGLDFIIKEKGPERALAEIERWKQEGHNADSRLRDYAVVAWAKGLMNSTPPEEKDPAVLAKKKAEYGERQELNRELYAAVMRGEKEPPPGVTREQLRDAVEGDKTGERVPLSFGEKNLYEEFKADVMKTLADIGVTDATVQAVGSQAQGFTGNPKKPAGKPFQPGKSDADFAINSVQLLRMAKQAGVPLNPKVVLDGKYYVLKNETPQGTGFYQTVGKRFAALAAKWNERVYGDPNAEGFDFKMNIAVEPFESAINVARPRKDRK